MTGASETYTVEAFERWAANKAQEMTDPDFTQPLIVCKYLVSTSTKDNFVRAHDPLNQPWPPLKHPRKGGKTHPLWDTGRLVASTGAGVGHVEHLSRDTLIYGTNVVYAGIHNYGGTLHIPSRATRSKGEYGKKHPRTKAYSVRIPQRQFLGIGPDLGAKIEGVFAKWIEEHLQ